MREKSQQVSLKLDTENVLQDNMMLSNTYIILYFFADNEKILFFFSRNKMRFVNLYKIEALLLYYE